MVLQARASSTPHLIALLGRSLAAGATFLFALSLHAQTNNPALQTGHSTELALASTTSVSDVNRDRDAIPDAPTPQSSGTNQASSLPQQRPPQSPRSPLGRSGPLSFGDKFTMYTHETFGPPAVIFPALAAGMSMATPKDHYPPEWRQGAQAFGRLYGDAAAMVTSRKTASFMTGVILHEDPRYAPSSSKNPFARTMHAVAFTFVDNADSGRRTVAFSNFAGAAAGGFVGMSYMPRGYNDVTHAEQRMAIQFGAMAIGNIAAEFQPQWGPIVHKLRIDKVLPEWWVPKHK